MSKPKDLVRILMADDDEDDRLLAQAALEESNVINPIDFVEDGVQLLDYLYRRPPYDHLQNTSLPGLILLDLNMPRKDGREALEAIRADHKLRHIPVVILTTSQQDADVMRSYDLGANSYITKPVTFDGLVNVMSALKSYWLQIVELPDNSE